MSIGLTPRMRELHDFIVSFEAEHGYSPSYDEMCDGIGKARSNIHRLVTGLEKRGAVRRVPHAARSISATPDLPTSLEVAREHVAYCIHAGMGLRQILGSIFKDAPASTRLTYAIEQVAVAWERLQEDRQ